MTQTVIPSGLGESVGWSEETTPGTFATSGRWIPHNKAEFDLNKKTAESAGIRGSRFTAGARRVLLSRSVKATVEYDLADKQFGIFLGAMLGSSATATVLGATTLYQQNHVPGFLEGHTLSCQKGVPFTTGSPQSFSYNGLKVQDFTISCQRDQIAKLALTLDGWDESTAQALTAPAYLSGSSLPNLLTFAGGACLLGGTATTTSGVTTVTGNAAPLGIVSGFTVKGVNKTDNERIPFGSKTKQEQLTNGLTVVSGEVEMEFTTLADFYTAFAADSSVVLVLNLLGGNVQSSYQSGLYLTLPLVKWDGKTPNANGTEVIKVKVPFSAYEDTNAGNPAIQAQYISTDTAR